MGEWLSSALPAVKKLHATSIVTHYRDHKHQPTSAVGEGPAFSRLAGVSSQPAATPPPALIIPGEKKRGLCRQKSQRLFCTLA